MAKSEPRPKGPPLNALRAFEAAARLGGFAAAAEELCVTPGAVSQHVKTLEAWAGGKLFDRRSQGLSLTPLGKTAGAEFARVFDRLGDAVQSLRTHAAPEKVQIATLPSIAQLWLLPRLGAIRDAVPDAVISVSTMPQQPNFRREPIDIGIFYEDASDTPDVITICDDVMYPVCAPSVAARLGGPENLSEMTFLHDAAWAGDWDRWIAAAFPGLAIDTSGPVFSLYSLALEETRNGAGVLIGHEPLVQRWIDSGDLAVPFDVPLATRRALTLRVAGGQASEALAQKVADAIQTMAQ